MNWAGKQHPIEIVAEWLAPALFAAAVAWAARSASLPVAVIGALAVLAFAGGCLAMRVAGNARLPSPRFEPAVFEPSLPSGELEELLLGPEDEVLILDDPLNEVSEDSRVVRMFAREEATPGELVDRISNFLGEGRQVSGEGPAQPAAPPTDASAALHAALANIRASLR